ncbi:lysylphosphatidylglycerol synthase transmembrane domain-containing protein [Tepidiforma flava]|uniref:Lysylphosphatidylglycerol synthase transmembrane domain-containing protein n=1 Tax=Tepidiforma flava TaxID=3004094 RepID=A0ABY7M527_9CHLR|nr:lysylphosphatidylglycerol synthase transmembrane domain-containing protein [Tepidiforma flava]WBL35624.1 lysylphosphatidylglycerol synthase transmembrane domain-containing protein [Tepidiforma flava]
MIRSLARSAPGFVVTAASVALLWQLIPWTPTVASLRTADPLFVALAIACLVASLVAKTVRWRLLLPESAPVTTRRLYRILHISFLLNNVLPARLGDVARVAMTTRQPGIRLGHVLSSMLTERVTDTVTLLLCFLAVSPFLPVPARYEGWKTAAWVIVAALAAAVALGALFRGRLRSVARSERLHRRLPANQRIRAEASSFADGLGRLFRRERVVHIWGWSWTAWVGAFAINYLLMRALAIDAPLAVAVLLTCTTNLAMLLPSSPGAIGVFHIAATASLLPFGVPEARALSFAILAHLVNVVPVSLIGAALLLASRDRLSPALLRREASPAAQALGDD